MPFSGVITRVSVSSDATEANGGSYDPSLSADGRYVTFHSGADNLVSGDTNGDEDIFVHDRNTGLTTRVSVASDGTEGNSSSFIPILSADGRYAMFGSSASNLVTGDNNSANDIFVHDWVTGQTTRVSVASDGTEGNDNSRAPSLSADGRYVTFSSDANNLVDGDANGWDDIFVHDRVTGQTTRISVASDGTEGNGGSYNPNLSADGRYVTFNSGADNLVSGDTNGDVDIFVHDRNTGLTTRVSVASDGTEGNSSSSISILSADGRYVTFGSSASNLVTGDNNSANDIFVHDRVTGQTTRVSVASDGTEGNDNSRAPSLSADGRYVTFHSSASNLVTGDNQSAIDIFVHDRVTGQTARVSVASDGTEGNGDSVNSSLSADGQYVTFHSYAPTLVDGDTNIHSDVFTAPNPLFDGPVDWVGTPGNDRMEGGNHDDIINGIDGNDVLIGGAGNDTLIGGLSVNDLRDMIYGGDGDDIIRGGYGNDELRGDAGNDDMAGGFGADTVIGGSGNDVLTGSALSDLLFGGDGMDFVNGGWGHDRVNGGADADRFFHLGILDHGSDWIQDYDATEGDVLVFGIASADGDDFQVNFTHTASPAGERSGDDNVEEAFVIYQPTGQIMWALVDGHGQSEINIVIAGITYDLLA